MSHTTGRENQRTGEVFLRDYDLGMVSCIGGELISAVSPDGKRHRKYAVPISEIPDGFKSLRGPPDYGGAHIPVVFSTPEDVYQGYLLPCFVLRRGDPAPAMERWHNIGAREYRIPADGAAPITVTLPNGETRDGYTKYEQKKLTWPFDIPYDIMVMARRQNDAVRMLRHIMGQFPPYGVLPVVDSEGITRTYEVFMEGVADISELADIQNRTQGFSLALRVVAELDLEGAETKQPMLSAVVTTGLVEEP